MEPTLAIQHQCSRGAAPLAGGRGGGKGAQGEQSAREPGWRPRPRHRGPGIALRLAVGCAMLLAVGIGTSRAAPGRRSPAPAVRRGGQRSRVRMPANLPPLISITSPRPEYRAAETRLGEFIRAIQMGRRKRATELLSSRVTAEERQALIEKRWLRKDPRNRKDFTQVLFLPDLKIGTQLLKGETLELYVIPRPKVKKRAGGGYLKVRMRRENGQWLVDMHPDRR